jgi:hypothetical protein
LNTFLANLSSDGVKLNVISSTFTPFSFLIRTLNSFLSLERNKPAVPVWVSSDVAYNLPLSAIEPVCRYQTAANVPVETKSSKVTPPGSSFEDPTG